MTKNNSLSSIQEIINDAKNGKMFILVDDEGRENEGDLVIIAEKCDANQVNFMAKYGRGLICLALNEDRVEKLGLPLMAMNNKSRHGTAFTVSIEAKEGISTGISAADRAKTVAVAIDSDKNKNDIVSPGHIFPLRAKNGGVLVRAGHTEAAVDVAKLAGCQPSGVICEIMNDDGTMARMPDLIEFSKKHNIKIATIADLIKYRRHNEKLITRQESGKINSKNGGEFDYICYHSQVDNSKHIALIKGEIQNNQTNMVRMHHLNLFNDVLLNLDNPKNDILSRSMEKIAQNGSGVIVMICPSGEISDAFFSINNQKSSNEQQQLKQYGVGAQILLDLGIKKMTLLTNAKKAVIGLEGYGLAIESYQEV